MIRKSEKVDDLVLELDAAMRKAESMAMAFQGMFPDDEKLSELVAQARAIMNVLLLYVRGEYFGMEDED